MTTVDYSSRATGVIRIAEDDRETYSIKGGSGNDTLGGNVGNDTLVGGKGNDSLKGGDGADLFIYTKGDGNDIIADYAEDDTIQFNSDTVNKVKVSNSDLIFTLASKAKITLQGAADKVVSYTDASGEHTYPETVIFNGKGTAATLTSAYLKDSFDTAEYEDGDDVKVIDASAVEHDMNITGNKLANKITGTEENDYIDGGAGKDTLLGGDGNDSLVGGKGNDNLTGGAGDDTFIYNNGDGNDVITDYEDGDVIKIASGTLSNSAALNGNDYIFSVGKGKITVKNGKGKYIHLVDSYGNDVWWPSPPTPGWVLQGTTVTLTDEYKDDTFNVGEFDDFATTVRIIDASAATKSLEITGNKQANKITGTGEDDTIHGGAGKDTIYGGDGDDVIEGGTGNDVLTGGDGADTFVYNKGDGNDKITDYTSDDAIILNSDSVKNVKEKNGSIVLTLASKKTITLTDAADKVVTVNEEVVWDGGKETAVELNAKNTAVTLTSSFEQDTFDVAAEYPKYSIATVDASAVENDLTIIGTKKANVIIGTAQNDYIDGDAGADKLYGGKGADTLVGSSGDDTLEGGVGNDSLAGGAGADVFVWTKGDGNDKIVDYEEEDTLQFNSDTVDRKQIKGDDVIFTLASKAKITIVGGADKTITYVDDKGENSYPETVKFNTKGTAATLTSAYTKDSFDIADYGDYNDSVVTINAAQVENDLVITANKKANNIVGSGQNDYIYGGAGKDTIDGSDGADTLEGGAGDDYLTGGYGADMFVYNNGDGNDVIADFTSSDRIVITSGRLGVMRSTTSGDAILKVGNGSITVTDGANKYIPLYDAEGYLLDAYTPDSFVEDDEEVLSVNNASLSEIVEGKSYAALGSTDTALTLATDKSYVPVVAQSSKK